jgi:hypothetical protein
MQMLEKSIYSIFIVILIALIFIAFWRIPVTKYKPKNDDEYAITNLFIKYIHARNDRDVDEFLSTLDNDCQYMVDRDRIVSKKELKEMLPELWMQNDDNGMVFGSCMTWECVDENYFKTGMLINPKFKISDLGAEVKFQFSAGVFLDENFFQLTKKNNTWRITRFLRPIN